MLCTPNNPTGAVYPSEAIAEFFHLSQSRSIDLIIDETYKDFPNTAPHRMNFFIAELGRDLRAAL